MEEIDKIALIEIQNRKILSTRTRGICNYYIPGGKREFGETDIQTLEREVLEELNVLIDPHTVVYIGTFKAQADSAKEGVIVKMTCYKAKFKGELKPSSEIEEIAWLNFNDLAIISEVDKKIFSHLKERNLID